MVATAPTRHAHPQDDEDKAEALQDGFRPTRQTSPTEDRNNSHHVTRRVAHGFVYLVPPRRFERPTPALGWQGTAFWFFIPLFAMILRVSRRLSVAVCC